MNKKRPVTSLTDYHKTLKTAITKSLNKQTNNMFIFQNEIQFSSENLEV